MLGAAAGFAVGIFVYPYIFLADIVAAERVENPASRKLVAKGTFVHANPSYPIYYGKEERAAQLGAVALVRQGEPYG